MKSSLLCALGAALLAAAVNPYEGKPDAFRAGAKLYARHCAQCHGRDAEGYGRAPSLHSATVQAAPPEALFQTLTNGVIRRGMPGWGHLPAEQRWQIVTYLRSLK
jgi:mono/diheme cytochrome c family protein